MTIEFGRPQKSDDLIDHPDHYAHDDNGIEPIQFIMANDPRGYYVRGAVTKYAARAGHKRYDGMDLVESEITDWKKAMRYCEMRVRQLEGKPVI
jgi:hypothetical protein